jgi:CHRD domain-containing protein
MEAFPMTRSRMILALATVIGLTVSVGSATAHDKNRPEVFRAVLLGENETPSISTPAFGRFRAVIDDEAKTITFRLTYQDLTGNVLFAHIHIGQRHTAGGVMVFLCGGGGKPACPASTPGVEVVVNGVITAENVIGPTLQGIEPGEFEEVLEAIRGGNAYANVHSDHNEAFARGEIRGQLSR